MRIPIFVLSLLVALSVVAQTAPAPKNLQVLPAGTDIRAVMEGNRVGLGVSCSYCHVQGNFASDDNPKKPLARLMLKMVREMNSAFDASPLMEGRTRVTCFTCHRGEIKPISAPPKS
jgi:hypothetical protein